VQEQLEEALQEVEELRNTIDALKADNATLLAERSQEQKPRSATAEPYGNGDLQPLTVEDSSAASLELQAARQRIADLEVTNLPALFSTPSRLWLCCAHLLLAIACHM
jgi:chromosome segregation ATPase